jgi:hypothetical protein
MVSECDSRCLPSYPGSDATLDGLLRHQPDRPPRPALRRWPAYHRDDRRLLRAVEQWRWLGARIVAQRVIETALEIALADARRLSPVTADRRRHRSDGEPFVEKQQRADAPPVAGAHLRAARLHQAQLRAIQIGQLHTDESRTGVHHPKV